MKSQFTKYDLMRPLRSAARHFGVQIQNDCQRKWVEGGVGKQSGWLLSVYDFEDGVQALVLDGNLPQNWEIRVESGEESPFILLFNVRGKLTFGYGGLDGELQLEPLKTVLMAHPAGQSQWLRIRAREETVFVVLHIDRKLYAHHVECLPEDVQKEVATIFSGETAIKLFANGNFGMEGAALVQQIAGDKQQGLIHATYVEAKLLELFSLQLRRWEREISGGGQPQRPSLRPSDVESILLARNYLTENLQQAPTIEELSKKAAINRQKLKQGFKAVFGKTVNEYLRGERLKMASHLLRRKELTVKEISVRVGYENSSYFARRFKKVYGLYPNEYAAVATELDEEE